MSRAHFTRRWSRWPASSTTALGIVAALAAYACTDSSRNPTAAVFSAERPSFTSYDAASRTLGVQILSNVNKFTAEGPATIRSSVSGGTGPYFYRWYISRRTSYGVDDFTLYDYGWGLDSVSFYVYPEDLQIRFRLSVGDHGDPTFTGNYQRAWLGPAAANASWPGDPCSSYPDDNLDVRFGDPWAPDRGHWRFWHHEVCTWNKIYDSTNVDTTRYTFP